MVTTQPKFSILPATPTAAGTQPEPSIALFEQALGRADRGKPVLYVHGATFPSECSIFFKLDGASWADHLNARGFSVWSIDFAGFGRSARYPQMATGAPEPGTPLGRIPDAARQIERAVRAIVAQAGVSNVSIIAHSWGTMAAAAFAGNHPALVDRLVLFGPISRRDMLPAAPLIEPWRLVSVEEQRQRFVEDVPPGEPAVLIEAEFPSWADLYLKFDPTSVTRTPSSVKIPGGPRADIMSAWSGAFPYDPSKVQAPVAIIRGEWDSLCNDADAAWLTNALSGTAGIRDVKIPKATHLMHLEVNRAALYDATAAFLLGQELL